MSPRLRPELPAESTQRNGAPLANETMPRAAIADQVRDIIDLLVSKDISDDVLMQEVAELREISERLSDAAAPGKRVRVSPDVTAHPQDYFVNGPTAGWANPLALPIQIWGVDTEAGTSEIRGKAIFSLAYEGPPTCVHGGIIALVFDEILGNANLIANMPGMTGTLKIRYSKPTPLMTPLDLEARLIRVDGRKISTYAAISCNGQVTAEAEGLFISVPPEAMLAFMETNASNAEGTVVDPEIEQAIRAAAEERAQD